MSEAFDPYSQWLGIQPHEMPVDHYRLLGVARFEPDVTVIAAAADARMAHLRTFQTGPRGTYTQRLLNEISTARICLLNPNTKLSYDQMLEGLLQASMPPPGPVAETEPRPAVLVPPPRQTASRPWLLGIFVGLIVAAIGVAAIIGLQQLSSDQPARFGEGLTDATGAEESAGEAWEEGSETEPVLVYQEADGGVHFDAAYAQLHGPSIVLGQMKNVDVMTHWESMDDWVSWDFKVVKAPPQGVFQVKVTYAARPEANGGSFVLAVGDQEKECEIRGTGEPVTDEYFLAVKKTGDHTLTVRAKSKPADRLMTLKAVTFVFPQQSNGEDSE